MNKIIKIIILILLNISVYFIYQNTKNISFEITSIGDSLSLGINSYGIKEYSYIDYYIDFIKTKKKKINLNTNYSSKERSINNLLELIKNNNIIKKDLINSDILLLNVGYNDLIYKISIEENIDEIKFNKIMNLIKKDYINLIKEVRKYYKEDIIIIGYYETQKNNYYLNKGINKLNQILKSNKEVIFIDNKDLIKNRKKFFSNPNSIYPNREGYIEISNKIIEKTLEIY